MAARQVFVAAAAILTLIFSHSPAECVSPAQQNMRAALMGERASPAGKNVSLDSATGETVAILPRTKRSDLTVTHEGEKRFAFLIPAVIAGVVAGTMANNKAQRERPRTRGSLRNQEKHLQQALEHVDAVIRDIDGLISEIEAQMD